jgi:adenosylhomocysteinase
MGIETFGWHGATEEEYEHHLLQALSCKPDVMIDDGGDLTQLLHGDHPLLAVNLIAGCEETTTPRHGAERLGRHHVLHKQYGDG